MTPTLYRSSRPDNWTLPKPHTDANQRYIKHGPIRPMDGDRGFFGRLFGR